MRSVSLSFLGLALLKQMADSILHVMWPLNSLISNCMTLHTLNLPYLLLLIA